MNVRAGLALLMLVLTAAMAAAAGRLDEAGAREPQGVRFEAVDVLIDARDARLAAYQVTVTGGAGVTLVGVEGGAHPAFEQPAYYDPAALHAEAGLEKIILAAFSLDEGLPTGETRVARLHLMVRGVGAPALAATLTVAADAHEQHIDAGVRLTPAATTDTDEQRRGGDAAPGGRH